MASRRTAAYAIERSEAGLHVPDPRPVALPLRRTAVGSAESSRFVPTGAAANALLPDEHGTINSEPEIAGGEHGGQVKALDSRFGACQCGHDALPEITL